jgi:superfamily II DNA or RNA helicase
MSVIIGYTDIVAQLKTSSKDVLDLVERELSYSPSGVRYTHTYKKEDWDGRISFLSKPQLRFSSGFVPHIITKLKLKGWEAETRDQRKKVAFAIPSDDWIKECLYGVELRDYQVEAAKAFLTQDYFNHRRGVFDAPTGSGKTVMMAAVIVCLHKTHPSPKQLFLTHRAPILDQTIKRFQEYFDGNPMVLTTRNKNWQNADLVISTIQTIQAYLRKDKKTNRYKNQAKAIHMIEYLDSVDVLLVDEVHRVTAKGFQEAIEYMQNTTWRLGVSATPFRSGKESRLKVMSAIGPVCYKIGKDKLIKRDLLAKPMIKFIKIRNPRIPKSFGWDKAYRWGIVNHPYRNKVIVTEAVKLADKGDKVLILVIHIDHGKRLGDALANAGRPTRFVHGGTAGEQRERVMEAFESKGADIVIMSTVADEGIDIPIISAVILAGGGKSTIRFIQRIGRGMRPSETTLKVLDFVDFQHKMLLKHSYHRFKLARKEEGYKLVKEFSHAA